MSANSTQCKILLDLFVASKRPKPDNETKAIKTTAKPIQKQQSNTKTSQKHHKSSNKKKHEMKYKLCFIDFHINSFLVKCPPLDAPVNGTVNRNGSQAVGTTAIYTCDSGIVDGNSVRYCLVDGTWSGAEPTCAAG